MPTTRSASNGKRSSLARVDDAGLGESGEGPESQVSDMGGPNNDDLQVCLPHTSSRLAAPGTRNAF